MRISIAAIVLLAANSTWALINPKFTPVQLVRQAELILQLETAAAPVDGKLAVRLVRAVKGAAPKAITLDLTRTALPQAKHLADCLEGRPQLAMLFAGKLGVAPAEGGNDDNAADPSPAGRAALHVNGTWFRLSGGAGNAWSVEEVDKGEMQAVWAGGSDMLLRLSDYVLADQDAAVPVVAGVNWDKQIAVGKLDGKISAMLAVDMKGNGRMALMVCCEGGDRIYQCEPNKSDLRDITASLKLASKSRCAAWGDFNGDGLLDLASWNGDELQVWLACPDGTFELARPKGQWKGGCLGLSAIGGGVKGRAAVLATTEQSPILISFELGDKLETKTLLADGKIASLLGRPHACLVADFDGDGVADILQPFEKGSIFFKGKGDGLYAEPTASSAVGTGPGNAAAFVGDYDADGLLDVFVAAQERCLLWHDLGGGKFTERLAYAGEAGYISKPNGIGGMTCDINNDGRQDVLILYSDIWPQFFFNRGFRSFGHAHDIDLGERELLKDAEPGCQAGCVADFNGDGAQDLALALKNGQVVVFFRSIDNGSNTAVRVAGSPKAAAAGPFTVTASTGKQALGAWNIIPGGEAFFGLSRAGECTLRWHRPPPRLRRNG